MGMYSLQGLWNLVYLQVVYIVIVKQFTILYKLETLGNELLWSYDSVAMVTWYYFNEVIPLLFSKNTSIGHESLSFAHINSFCIGML